MQRRISVIRNGCPLRVEYHTLFPIFLLFILGLYKIYLYLCVHSHLEISRSPTESQGGATEPEIALVALTDISDANIRGSLRGGKDELDFHFRYNKSLEYDPTLHQFAPCHMGNISPCVLDVIPGILHKKREEQQTHTSPALAGLVARQSETILIFGKGMINEME